MALDFCHRQYTYISTPAIANIDNTMPYDSNGFSIKLYGVKNEIVIIISQDNDEVTRIILYFIGILFFIVNHHYTKLQDMTRNF